MLNKVVLMGRLTRAPECKYVGERKVANFTPEQVIRQSIRYLIKQKVFTYQEMSMELRHYGLRLTANQLKHFAMQGCFLQ